MTTQRSELREVEELLINQAQSRGLDEASLILQQLASVFFPGGVPHENNDPYHKTAQSDHELDLAARYQTLVEQIPAVVFLAFLDRGIGEAYVSPQIESILGFSQEEWLNDPVRWYQQVHAEDRARWSIEAAQMFLSGEPIRSVYRVIARDGHVVWFHCEAKMVRRDDGRPWFIHGVGFDITELKEAEAALLKAQAELERRVKERTAELASANAGLQQEIIERKRAEKERTDLLAREQVLRQEAEVASRIKDEFLATVSHELRTPLNAILGWTTILRSGSSDKVDASHALEVIERNARAQQRLIEDLLDVSRIISGKLRLDLIPVDLVKIIENCVDTARPAAEAKRVTLEFIQRQPSIHVSADPARLQQIIWNLLSNAVKFTPSGGRVAIEHEPLDSNVQISVKDSGIGINSAFLPHVFDRFRQADGSFTREHGGLGLGLAIVRHLVELLGGSVEAYSAGKGQGATFRITLPLLSRGFLDAKTREESHLEVSPAIPAFDNVAKLDGLHVLVVDDEADALEMVSTILRKFGAKVAMAKSSSAALEALSQENFDALISDLEMPGEHGYELMVKVRAREKRGGKRIPAIALSAHGRYEDRMRSLMSGYNAHLTKPLEPSELVALVSSLAGTIGSGC